MLRPIYNWALRVATGRYALPALAGIAVIEATFPFIPPDVMLAPMVLARRERAWLYAGVCTVASVLGGCIGYAFGYLASPLALRLLEMTGRGGGLHAFQELFARIGVAVILIKGFTPVPYMVVTIASGLAHFSLPLFIGASIVVRGGRFFLEAALLQHPHAKAFVDRHLVSLVVGGLALLGAGLLLMAVIERHHPG